MTNFDSKFFIKFDFSNEQKKIFYDSALKDLKIASQANVNDVKFQFVYNALIKLGITLIACSGYKAKSRVGHHIKIIEQLAKILKDENILAYGNQMRKTRNTELYDGGIMITKKQVDEYCNFVINIFKKSKNVVKEQINTLF